MANEVVEDGFRTDDEVVCTIGAVQEFAEDPKSEVLHQLPALSPLFNVHVDLSPF